MEQIVHFALLNQFIYILLIYINFEY